MTCPVSYDPCDTRSRDHRTACIHGQCSQPRPPGLSCPYLPLGEHTSTNSLSQFLSKLHTPYITHPKGSLPLFSVALRCMVVFRQKELSPDTVRAPKLYWFVQMLAPKKKHGAWRDHRPREAKILKASQSFLSTRIMPILQRKNG